MSNLLKEHGLIGGAGGASIKSVQNGTGTMTTTSTSITISPVVTANTLIIVTAKSNGVFTEMRNQLRVILNSSTGFSILRGNTGSTLTYTWQVIEFENVKSIQKGNVFLDSSSIITINNVNTNKSFLYFNYSSDNDSLGGVNGIVTNSTSIKFETGLASRAAVEWTLIEFA